MLYPNPDLLYYIAIGDAAGLSTEYIKLPRDEETYRQTLEFKRYIKHPKHPNKPGTFTDDTLMSIWNTEVLLGFDFSKLAFANAWVSGFQRDPRDAFARQFQKFLEEIKTGQEFLDKINPVSNKNGAAMRSVPFGVLKDTQEVIQLATLQASITHNTTGGLFGAQAIALMSHFSLHENLPFTREALGGYLRHHLRNIISSHDVLADVFQKEYTGSAVGPEVGIVTAKVVFETLISHKSLLEMLRSIIERGGDTDSCAALALGIGSARFPDDLPAFMHNNLEPGSLFGASYLKDLGLKLIKKYYNQ